MKLLKNASKKRETKRSFLSTWSIGKRILGGFLVVSALTAVAGVTGIVNIGTIGRAMDRVAYDEAPTVDAANEMKIAMALARNAMEEYKGATSTIAADDASAI
ncbi:MAG: MCP four helix bundle domain-containing protein, partial [Candidatus Marinimicrobia bacterium]|nr:MCP four helix bundle domain-containing protein [Candidatus Neomarinimicrobiota bacterium]